MTRPHERGEAGVIDMLDVMDQITYLEKHYAVEVEVIQATKGAIYKHGMLWIVTVIPRADNQSCRASYGAAIQVSRDNVCQVFAVLHRSLLEIQSDLDGCGNGPTRLF